MSKNQNQRNVKINLSIDQEFFRLLQREAEKEHLKVSTFIKWFLNKHLLHQNKPAKCPTPNEKDQ